MNAMPKSEGWHTKPRPKVARWSHQKELDRLRGREIGVRFIEEQGNGVRGAGGVLEEADQFTLKIRNASTGRSEIFFKAGLLSFRELVA